MKNLIDAAKAYLKKVFSDVHNVIVGIVLMAFLGGGSIYLSVRNLWTQLKTIIQSPTPLWATIALTAICCLYICVKVIKIQAKLKEAGQQNNSLKSPPLQNFGFVENGDLKWKVHLVSGSVYKVEDAPYCVKHDLQLPHFKDGYVCFHVHEDGCEAQLADNDYAFRKTYVETVAERQFRRPEKV